MIEPGCEKHSDSHQQAAACQGALASQVGPVGDGGPELADRAMLGGELGEGIAQHAVARSVARATAG